MAASSDLRITLRAVDQASGVIGNVQRALTGLGSAVAAPAKAMGGLMDGLGKVGLAAMGVQALAGAAQGLGNVLGVGVNNSLEQARAGIQAFTKDAGQTEQILAMVRDRAAKTPFAFNEMATAAGSLMPIFKSTGIELETLLQQAEILAASNPMEGLAGASFSLREAMTGDFTSIIERFNLSRQSINKWKDEGLSNFEIVQRAMQEMGFDADLVAAKSETLAGRWSTFNDSIDAIKATIGEPIFDALKEGLTFLQEQFDKNQESIAGFASAIAETLAGAVQVARDAFSTLIQVFEGTWLPTDDIHPFVNAVGQMGLVVRDQVLPAVSELAAWLGEQLPPIVSWLKDEGWPVLTATGQALADVIRELWTETQLLFAELEKLGVMTDLNTIATNLTATVRDLALALSAAMTPASRDATLATTEQSLATTALATDIKSITTDLATLTSAIREVVGWVKNAAKDFEAWREVLLMLHDPVGTATENLNRYAGAFGPLEGAIRAATGAALAFRDALNSIPERITTVVRQVFEDSGERAMGGPVLGGHSYLVGERGPELFVPTHSGSIVPNHMLGGSVGGIGSVTINVSAPDPAAAARMVRDELIKLSRRNGGSAFGGLG